MTFKITYNLRKGEGIPTTHDFTVEKDGKFISCLCFPSPDGEMSPDRLADLCRHLTEILNK